MGSTPLRFGNDGDRYEIFNVRRASIGPGLPRAAPSAALAPVEIHLGQAAAEAMSGRVLLLAEEVLPNATALPVAVDVDDPRHRIRAKARRGHSLPGLPEQDAWASQGL
jgi:hypothetical protein